jgi:hypothetical protein
MTLSITNSIDENVWREFVNQNPQGNIFHTPEMLQVFEHTHGHHPQLHAALDGDEQLHALLLPVRVTLKNGLLRNLTTRSVAYGGVLYSNNETGKRALELLLEEYSEGAGREALFTELRNLSDQSAIQPILRRCGFSYEDHLDYLIDLDCSSEQVLQNIGSRTRKHIRQALKRGNVTVEEIVDRSQIADWYELIQKTYLTARVPLADRSLFEAAFDILHPRGMVIFWLARLGSVIVASSAELLYKDVIYGWYGAVDRSYSNESLGELLLWRILEWGVNNGYKTYDFGGAGKPNEAYGVRDFKAKFGGQLVSFGRNTCIHAPALFHLSKLGYSLFRRWL